MPAEPIENLPSEYHSEPETPFSISLINERTVRLRISSRPGDSLKDRNSLMLVADPQHSLKAWKAEELENSWKFASPEGQVIINKNPWRFTLLDKEGKILTESYHQDLNELTYSSTLPFCNMRRASNYSRGFNAAFVSTPTEKIFGCGESFGNFDKTGTKVVLSVTDANGVESTSQYKPVPFFMSNRGYGVFIHTSAPTTIDFSASQRLRNAIMVDESELDLFFFIGCPKTVLTDYTALTGRAKMPPLWSFGHWMSRISYDSEEQVRQVAIDTKRHRIPTDVIYIDTGWFETDWQCDYQFSRSRFKNPRKMIQDLQKEGFKVSLWQLPYFSPKNSLYLEIIRKGLHVMDSEGGVPYDDVVLDFSNPETLEWYREKLLSLFNLGVSAIKVDFGESAPIYGRYASGKCGHTEHNLYPLRYNQAVFDTTEEAHGYGLIWARSAWAGSQRYPVHWGGDPSPTNEGMAASLRGGLSLGVSGFTFWSNDIGGFVQRTDEKLLRRWLGLGMFCSHARRHGHPPTEPWNYSKELLDDYRAFTTARYQLTPYYYTQSKLAAENGHPLIRPLFFEFPNDPGSWLIDQQFMVGTDILICPFFEECSSLDVYLPKGNWVDVQTGCRHAPGWHRIAANKLPVHIFARENSAIPMVPVAQNTDSIEWDQLYFTIYPGDSNAIHSKLYTPGEQEIKEINFLKGSGNWSTIGESYRSLIK
ncbi:MAG: DUF4968 domain-containing protein [Opitutales bacterium]|nr:DUF4968 domain-containing protein [Opitutales bacterium]